MDMMMLERLLGLLSIYVSGISGELCLFDDGSGTTSQSLCSGECCDEGCCDDDEEPGEYFWVMYVVIAVVIVIICITVLVVKCLNKHGFFGNKGSVIGPGTNTSSAGTGPNTNNTDASRHTPFSTNTGPRSHQPHSTGTNFGGYQPFSTTTTAPGGHTPFTVNHVPYQPGLPHGPPPPYPASQPVAGQPFPPAYNSNTGGDIAYPPPAPAVY